MIKKNSLGSKYVNVHANNISIWSAPSRRTIFVWGADIALDKPIKNSKSSRFHKKKEVKFRTHLKLKKEQCIEVLPSLK
jgi:hypothetical protein